MTKSEYWILNSVVEARWPLWALALKDLDEWANYPGHGLDRPELVEILERLFRRGSLIAQPEGEGQRSLCPIGLPLSMGSIRRRGSSTA